MRRRPSRLQRAALSEVLYLYQLAARAVAQGDSEWARVLGRHIDRLYLKYRLRPLVSRKELVCKRCKTPHIPGVTTRVRIRKSAGKTYVLYTCRACGFSWKKIIRHKGREYRKTTRNARVYTLAWKGLSKKTPGEE